MPNVFITGVTGYIGGQFLHDAYEMLVADGVEITALIRSEAQREVLEGYPGVKAVVGDLNDATLIKTEAQDADVVLNLASTSNETCAAAIVEGLRARDASGHWIQISGASMFSVPDIEGNRYGEARDDCYDDVNDIAAILKLIEDNPKRKVDQMVLKQTSIRTALVVAPLIYGVGAGPSDRRSIQVPEMAKAFLQRRQGFKVGRGLSVWSNVHVSDLGNLLCRLVSAALGGKDQAFGLRAIYLPANGRKAFGELGEELVAEASKQGLMDKSVPLQTLTADEANSIMPMGAVFWATNAVTSSSRGQQMLGWCPEAAKLEEELAETVRREAATLSF